MNTCRRPVLVYALHSGELYGTERMALYTASGLSDHFAPVFLAPPGPLLAAAQDRGFAALSFSSVAQFSAQLRRLLEQNESLAFLATGVVHSFLCLAWNAWYRRRIAHLHLVHGGASERLSYGRKKLLNGTNVKFVAVSGYVRERLLAHGVAFSQINVIENFLPASQVAQAPRRPAFNGELPNKLIVVSRLDPEKQVGLLLAALESAADLARLEVRIFGTGWEFEALRRRIAARHLKVSLEGFSPRIGEKLAESDLLVHLCPVEPFGLVVLEAFAAGIPALVPDAGGAASLIENGRSGFHFRAGSPDDLISRLRAFLGMAGDSLNAVVAEERALLRTRFAESARLADYRALLLSGLAAGESS